MALSLLLKELPKLFFPEERDVLPRPRGVEPGGNSCDAMTRSMTAGAWRFQNIAAYAQPDSKKTVALSKLQFFMFLQADGVTSCKTMLYYHRFQKVRKIKVLKESA